MKTEYWYYLIGAGVLLYLYMAQTGSNPFNTPGTAVLPGGVPTLENLNPSLNGPLPDPGLLTIGTSRFGF